jgi:Cupin domain
VRRVITGIDANGKSVFVSDENVEPRIGPTLGGVKNWILFAEDEIPTVPNNGVVQDDLDFFPVNEYGYRFALFSYPPASQATPPPEDLEAAIAETERMLPGMSSAVTDSGGTHYTATVDLEYVLSGEFYLELDNGESTTLRAGDALVQCGARHHWENRSDDWATMLLVFIGAKLDAERFS